MAKDFAVAPLPEKTLTNISDCGYKYWSGMATGKIRLLLPGFYDDPEKRKGEIMFGIGMPELLVIAVVALLVVGPKKLPDIAKALGKGLSEFRKATDSATETIKETLKTDELKKDMNGFKDSLLHGTGEEKGASAPPVVPAGSVTSAPPIGSGSDAPKTADPKPQS
jgi:Tat protein translocase TatB subunit